MITKARRPIKRSPKKVSYKMNTLPIELISNIFETAGSCEQIRILKTNKAMRDEIYEYYGGKDIVDNMIKRTKLKEFAQKNQEKNLIVKDAKRVMKMIYDKISSEFRDEVQKASQKHNIIMVELYPSVEINEYFLDCSIDLFTNVRSRNDDIQNIKQLAKFYYDPKKKKLVTTIRKNSTLLLISEELKVLEAIGKKFDEFVQENCEYYRILYIQRYGDDRGFKKW